MASTWIQRHLHAVDSWNFLEYLEKMERQNSLFYSKWKVGFFWWFFLHWLCDSVCQLCSFTCLSTEMAKKMATRFFLQVCDLAKLVLLWTCLLYSVQYERILLNSMQYENLLNVFINANWMGQFLEYIIINIITFSISCGEAFSKCSPFLTQRRHSDRYILRPISLSHATILSRSQRENGILESLQNIVGNWDIWASS